MLAGTRRLASPPDETLPPDWRRAIDAATGRSYYYHRETRETTWTLPSPPPPSGSFRAAKENVKLPASAKDSPPLDAVPVNGRSLDSTHSNVDSVTGFSQGRSPPSRVRQPPQPADPEQVQRDLTLLKKRIQEMKKSAAAAPHSSSSALAVTPPVVTPAQRTTEIRSALSNKSSESTRREEQISESMAPPVKAAPTRRPPGPPAAAPAASKSGVASSTCTRKTGCSCDACTNGIAVEVDEDERVACPSCGRLFNANSLAKHARVCKKVFSRPPAIPTTPPSSSAKDVAGRGAPPSSSPPSESKPTSASKWRRQSAELRNALSRAHQATPSPSSASIFDEKPANASAAPVDDGLVQCPHCERRFSEKAAERHIPRCNDIRSKPKTLKRGEGRAAYTPPPAGEAKTPGSNGQPRGRKSVSSRLAGNELCPKCGSKLDKGHQCRRDSSGSWDGQF